MEKANLQINLEKKMKEKGFNMKSLSIMAGLNETAVRDIIKGRVNSPTYKNLSKICVVLECSVDELNQTNKTQKTEPEDSREEINIEILAKSIEKVDLIISQYDAKPDSITRAKLYLTCYKLLIAKGNSTKITDIIKKVV
ncbi:MAG: XRE family transcriptional regulator [Flavobacterium sp.]|nr:MAG: XRE family transcriptional regulator [Flavobacterium sp.]